MPYITPSEVPTDEFVCRTLKIPKNLDILAAVNGAINDLCNPYNWEKVEGVEPEEIASAMNVMWREYIASTEDCP